MAKELPQSILRWL